MRYIVLAALAFSVGCTSGSSGSSTPSLSGWEQAKAQQIPTVNLPTEFTTPYRQPLATLAWEDGVYISRDGLTLYADYFPADLLSIVLGGVTPDQFYNYERGPSIGQDFTNPLSQPHPWLHGDVAYAQRASLNESFTSWTLTNLKGQFYNLGAAVGILSSSAANTFDLFAYTDDSPGRTTIKILTGVSRSLASNTAGTLLSANVDESSFHQDNPHIERYDTLNPNKIVLFYDSDNKPGLGQHDIWYALSVDGGSTWTNPANVSSINTSGDEQQPHLYFDGTFWWLYFSATNPADGKLGIYRAKQGTSGNFDSWGARELVIGAGTAQAVGEPTLTSHGDISFVVVTKNTVNGTLTDLYDADPWFLPHR